MPEFGTVFLCSIKYRKARAQNPYSFFCADLYRKRRIWPAAWCDLNYVTVPKSQNTTVMSINAEAPEDQEPPGLSPKPGPEPTKGKVRRKALTSLRRELSDKELLSPAVQKLLLDEIDRLEEDNTELAGYRSRFHDADKKAAILQQKQTTSIAHEIISLSCITVGGAAIGYAPSVWASQPTGGVALAFGVVLVLGGIVAKAVKS